MSVVPKLSPYIVGIDLGTSNSAAAIYFRGRAEVVNIGGRPLLPSVIHMRESGERIIGYPAKNLLLVDPENTVSSVKREIGNAQFQREFKGQPGKQYSATDLSAEILAKIRSGVEQSGQIDLRGSLHYAVICIPANFDDVKKKATLEAARMAGFEVLRLLEEPVAAAIAYALEAKRDQKILVYDLGGGTFDVSILTVDSTDAERPSFRVLAKEGVPRLGGDDFDAEIMKIAGAHFKAQTAVDGQPGIDIFDLDRDQGISRRAIRQAQQKLKDAAETAKIELTEALSAQISIPSFLKDESGQMHQIELEVTREQFQAAIRERVLESRIAIEQALKSAVVEDADSGERRAMAIDDISRIILVGGSTRVPLVREMLVEMFGKEPYADLDPVTAVARGAAIFGAALGIPGDKVESTNEIRPEDTPDLAISITNIATHYLGIEIKDQRFAKVLDKGVEIPPEGFLERERDFSTQRDDQQEVRITVFQASDEPQFITDAGCTHIGEFFLSGIPPKPRGRARLKVKFELNQENLLKVTAASMDDSGQSASLEITRTL